MIQAKQVASLDRLSRAFFEVVVAPFTKQVTPGDLTTYQALGVGEVVTVATPPEEE